MHIIKVLALTLTLPFFVLVTGAPPPSSNTLSTPPCPLHLQKRGTHLSCLKPLKPSPPSSPLPPPSTTPALTWPAPAAFEFLCSTPALTAHYEPDCYCNPLGEITCDRRVVQMRATMGELRIRPARAAWLELRMLQKLEKEAGRVCRCGRPLERPFNPYTDRIVAEHLRGRGGWLG